MQTHDVICLFLAMSHTLINLHDLFFFLDRKSPNIKYPVSRPSGRPHGRTGQCEQCGCRGTTVRDWLIEWIMCWKFAEWPKLSGGQLTWLQFPLVSHSHRAACDHWGAIRETSKRNQSVLLSHRGAASHCVGPREANKGSQLICTINLCQIRAKDTFQKKDLVNWPYKL